MDIKALFCKKFTRESLNKKCSAILIMASIVLNERRSRESNLLQACRKRGGIYEPADKAIFHCRDSCRATRLTATGLRDLPLIAFFFN